jgi:hypothetical protein
MHGNVVETQSVTIMNSLISHAGLVAADRLAHVEKQMTAQVSRGRARRMRRSGWRSTTTACHDAH